MLQMIKVGKRYRKDGKEVTALAPINLAIQPKEFVAIEGPSGSGKTTLLLIAGGLLHPTLGQVRWHDQNIYALESGARATWRSQYIGFVFQQYHLLPYLTVLENILTPQIATPKGHLLERAIRLMQHFGLDHRQNHLPAELSAGEKQRTALARALLLEPKLILADEITGNLDVENASIVIGYLKEYVAEGGAVLAVTHDSTLAGQADRTHKLDTLKHG